MSYQTVKDFAASENTPLSGMERHEAAHRSTLVSVAVNLVLASVQIVVGLLARSSALVADGVHSLSDLVADFVVLFANRQSRKPADEDHHFGHARFENAASLALGALLVLVGIGMLHNAIVKFEDPDAIPRVSEAALAVAVLALVAKEGLFRYMLRIAKAVRSSMLVANAWHARSDAASSLVVAVGIVGNLAGLKLLDPIAAAVVGCMVCKMGWEFGHSAFRDLTDHSVSDEEQQAIVRTIAATPGVLEVHDLRTRRMGDLAVVDVHVLVSPHISVSEGHQISVLVQDRVMKAHQVLDVTLHVDADPSHEPTDLSLPSREALLDRINRQAGTAALRKDQLVAHYLHSKIELDILLPAGTEADTVERLRQVVDGLPEVRRCRILIEQHPTR
jgi:cation diffusion facilitator family transporter